jgi:hypothetical protein
VRAFRTLHEIHTPAERLLRPILALVFAAVAGVHPQVFETWEVLIGSLQKRLDSVPIHDLCAMDLGLEHEALGVHEQMTLLRPFTFLPPRS